MSDLYTVTIRTKQLVSKFDKSGKKISDETIFIEQQHHDCPAALVATYREMHAAAFVRAERQERTHSQPGTRRSSARTTFADSAPARHSAPQKPSVVREAPDYADFGAAAVNAAMRKEARV